jgi:SepF-like predicted cell division protein (DUF552 family)
MKVTSIVAGSLVVCSFCCSFASDLREPDDHSEIQEEISRLCQRIDNKVNLLNFTEDDDHSEIQEEIRRLGQGFKIDLLNLTDTDDHSDIIEEIRRLGEKCNAEAPKIIAENE